MPSMGTSLEFVGLTWPSRRGSRFRLYRHALLERSDSSFFFPSLHRTDIPSLVWHLAPRSQLSVAPSSTRQSRESDTSTALTLISATAIAYLPLPEHTFQPKGLTIRHNTKVELQSHPPTLLLPSLSLQSNQPTPKSITTITSQ